MSSLRSDTKCRCGSPVPVAALCVAAGLGPPVLLAQEALDDADSVSTSALEVKEERKERMKEAVNELPEGRFEILTDKLFAVDDTHTGWPKSFPRLAEWERRMSRDNGFDYAFVNAPVFQRGSVGGESYADNEMGLYMQWRGEPREGQSSRIYFWGTWVQTFSDLPNGAFSRSQGLLTSTISAGTDPSKSFVSPSALWWEQSFDNIGFSYNVGQLYATSLWGSNRYTADDREGFVNSVLSSNVGLPWSNVPRGLGAAVRKSTGIGYVAAGIQNANGDQKTIDFDTAFDGNYLYAAEFAYTPGVGTPRAAAYKLTVGRIDVPAANGNPKTYSVGWALSARGELNESIGLFAQYRRTTRGPSAQDIKASANAGVVFNRPFGWRNDAVGIGLFYAEPASSELRNEFGAELYWRLQLTYRLDMTPGLQVTRPTGRSDDGGTTVVYGLRLRFIL